MGNFPLSLSYLLIVVFVLAINFISKKSNRFKVGRLAIVGIFLALLPHARGDFTSSSFLTDIVISFFGIILILLDKKDYSTDKKDNKLSSED